MGTALAAGLLIGIERGWKLKDQKAGTRVAGVRTFTLLGLASGIAGLLGALGHGVVSGALAVGAVAIMVAAYARELKQQRDSTSAVAAVVTIAIGFLAGSGSAGLAIAAAAVTVAVLALKSELHGFVDRLKAEDVKALARYLIIAAAVLPFLPNRQMGPLDAWNPQRLWLVVVLVTGFSFLGYVANRIFGQRHVSARGFAAVGIGHADHQHLLDRRVFQQHPPAPRRQLEPVHRAFMPPSLAQVSGREVPALLPLRLHQGDELGGGQPEERCVRDQRIARPEPPPVVGQDFSERTLQGPRGVDGATAEAGDGVGCVEIEVDLPVVALVRLLLEVVAEA